MKVLRLGPVCPQQPDTVREVLVTAYDHPSVPGSAQVLGREETEAAQGAHTAGRLVTESRPDGLAAVFHDWNAVAPRYAEHRVHVGALPKQLDHNHGFHGSAGLQVSSTRRRTRTAALLQEQLERFRVHIEARVFTIHENRPRPQIGYSPGGGEERERDGHHTISLPNSEGLQRKQKGVRT